MQHQKRAYAHYRLNMRIYVQNTCIIKSEQYTHSCQIINIGIGSPPASGQKKFRQMVEYVHTDFRRSRRCAGTTMSETCGMAMSETTECPAINIPLCSLYLASLCSLSLPDPSLFSPQDQISRRSNPSL